MLKTFNLLIVGAFLSTLISCDSNTIIDEQFDMAEGAWHEDSLASFNFEIEDTTTVYFLDYNVRYAVNYPYYNLYVKYYLEDSVGIMISSELQELVLFDKKTGEPQGEGLGDLYDRNVRIFEEQKFGYSGAYTLKIKQFMRMQELPGILSFGVKIEIPKE